MVSRRGMIAGGAGAAVLAALGYRAWDRGVFSAGKGPAFAPWTEWQGQAGEGIVRPLHAAILAANPHDTQPWLFAHTPHEITVFADRRRNLGTFDPYRREMYLGLGCAIENMSWQVLSYSMGMNAWMLATGRLALSPPDVPIPVVKVRFWGPNWCDVYPECEKITPARDRIIAAIPKRHTNRGP
jgi:hypothetical protein